MCRRALQPGRNLAFVQRALRERRQFRPTAHGWIYRQVFIRNDAVQALDPVQRTRSLPGGHRGWSPSRARSRRTAALPSDSSVTISDALAGRSKGGNHISARELDSSFAAAEP